MHILEPCILTLTVLLALLCLLYPTENVAFIADSDYLGADGFPNVICVLIICSCVVRFFLTVLESKKQQPTVFATTEQRNIFVKTFIIITLYLVSFIHLGFYVSSLVYLCIFPLFIEGWEAVKKRTLLLYVFSVISVCYVLFHFFKIYLPETLLF